MQRGQVPQVAQRAAVAVDDAQDAVDEETVGRPDGPQEAVEVLPAGAVRDELEGVVRVIKGGAFEVGEAGGEGEGEGAGAGGAGLLVLGVGGGEVGGGEVVGGGGGEVPRVRRDLDWVREG